MRPQISLDGPWQFQFDPQNTLPLDQISAWRTIQVPGPWQAQFDDLRLAAGVGWYRRAVDVPADWAGRAVFLCFGAVDYYAEVWVNGQRVGDHEGGYLPFAFDVSRLLHFGGANEIVVRVLDPGGGLASFGMDGWEELFPQFPSDEIPRGKQSWYGPVGGIWQPVYLEARAPHFIRQLHVTPDGLSGRVSVEAWLSGGQAAAQLRLACLAPDGSAVAEARADLSPGQAQATLTFAIDDPALWHPDTPHLYTLHADLVQGDQVIDRQTATFGIRTFEARDGRLWLNGRVFYMRGVLDQDYYPEGIYTPPSLDYLRAQFQQAKAMGLNLLRCHIKVPDPRYLQAADEVGLLLWVDVPSWGRLTEAAGRRARETFAGMVARDWNHPSLVMWALVNEDWGTDLPGSEADRRWLLETYAWARRVDPHRVIVDNSPCIPNFHLQTDVDDYHFYAAMPDSIDLWQDFVTHFASRAPFTFSPNGDAVRTNQEPLVVSEFGNWGLPDLDTLKSAYDGKEPWWFATGGDGVVRPAGAEARFREAGLESVFGDWSSMAVATQWAQYRALKHEIEVMRAEPAIQGYVITEFTDLHWECNGLLDMARNPRVFAALMPALNADTFIVPRWERLAYWAGEPVAVDVLVSHYGANPLRGATLRWSLEGADLSGAFGPLDLEPGMVGPGGRVAFVAPPVQTQARAALRFWLEGAAGEVIARNELSMAVFPTAAQRAFAPLAAWAGDPVLGAWLEARGYTPGADGGLQVVARLDDDALRYVERGGRALLCTTEAGPVPGLSGVEVAARENTLWAGNWAGGFGWLQPGVTRLAAGPLIDFAWRGAIARHVITGAPAEDTLAGYFVGWVHRAAAFLVRVRLGQGVLTLTTFPVLPPDDTPARTVLLHDLIRAAST